MFDIFNQDAFSVVTMTDALQEVNYVPSYISRLGIFETESVDTLHVAIEKQTDESLIIVPSSPRGTHGATMGSDRRTLRNLSVPHYQINDAVMADRVQGVRAFGQERAVQSLTRFIAARARKARQSFELTEERQKLALITQGKLLDADGSVIYDYYTEMGESQVTEIDFDLDNASPAKAALRTLAESIIQTVVESLGGLPFERILVLCGNAFWQDLVRHKEMYDIFLGWQRAADLQRSTIGNGRSGIWGTLEFGGLEFVNYRGGQSVGIDTNKCYIIPIGVPDLFKTVYAPADYIETVNTMGLPLYAMQYIMQNRKGVALEFQSNALHYVTRPRVLISGRRT